jgi:hypothetical protein
MFPMMESLTMERPAASSARYLLTPLTVIGALLVVSPLVELALGLLPPKPGVAWRFGAEGLIGSATINICLGLLLLLAAGVLKGSVRQTRFTGWLSMFGALAVIVLMAAFALDTIQFLAIVKPVAKSNIKHAAVSGMIRDLMTCGSMVIIALAARRFVKDGGTARKSASSEGLLVRAPVSPAAVPPASKTAVAP